MARVTLLSLLFALQASAQTQTRWGQCGGDNYEGPTICPDTFACTADNRWYAQCLPVSGSQADTARLNPDTPIQTSSFQTVVTVTVTNERVVAPTVVTTYITFIAPSPTPIPTALPPPPPPPDSIITLVPDTPISSLLRRDLAHDSREPRREHPHRRQEGSTPTPSELQEGALWIRAVTDPHFHHYLQTTPQNLPGPAILGPIPSAGQYEITAAGQLVSLGDPTLPLYLHVERPADLSAPPRALATWFEEVEGGFGKFEFSGDAVVWRAEGLRRENEAAWLVCGGEAGLFVNTGPYGYMTPEGCSDHTVHYYNGARAD